MEYSPAIKKKEICLLHKRIDREGIMLSEISETENDRHCVVSHVESKNAELVDIESKTGVTRSWGPLFPVPSHHDMGSDRFPTG